MLSFCLLSCQHWITHAHYLPLLSFSAFRPWLPPEATFLALHPPSWMQRRFKLIKSAVISRDPTLDRSSFPMQPMHTRPFGFLDRYKIRRHSWMEAARLILVSVSILLPATQPRSSSSVTRCSATHDLNYFGQAYSRIHIFSFYSIEKLL